MSESSGITDLFYEMVRLSQRYDADPLRGERYEAAIADLKEAFEGDLTKLTFPEIDAIFAKHSLPAAHIADNLKRL